MMAAQRAPVGLKNPTDSGLQGVSCTDASKINRFAEGTMRKPLCSNADHTCAMRPPSPGCVRRRPSVLDWTAWCRLLQSLRGGRRPNDRLPSPQLFAPVFAGRAPIVSRVP